MKANELMIGDYVQVSPSMMPIKVAAVHHKKAAYHACINKLSWVRQSLLEPIPLTPEILEKNGWKPYIPENHLETVYACQDISKAVADKLYALWPYQDGSFYLLLRVDGKDMVRMDVHYIHQLQHALGLCGIEKEIVL